MEVFRGLDRINRKFINPVVTIGNFDGVHLAHQLLFKRVKKQAQEVGGESIVITFDPHPVSILRPQAGLKLISRCSKKLELIEKAGIDVVICIKFSLDFARTTAEEFVDEILSGKIQMKKIIVGYDYSFGRDRRGNIDFLRQRGDKHGFEVLVVEPFYIDNNLVSSTRVRELISAGDMVLVRKLLGRPYQMSGKVLVGKRRGGSVLGFPTANIALSEDELWPRLGVYATQVYYEKRMHNGVMNIGHNPTFGDKAVSAEVHIFDFEKDIYGHDIEVNMIERLRDEKKFADPEALVAQIKLDINRAQEILKCEEA